MVAAIRRLARHSTLTRHLICSFVLVAVFCPPGWASAQTSTQSLLSAEALGLPELVITATEDGWDAPDEITAGRYLLTASYQGEREFATTAFAKLPEDWTIDDFNQRLADSDAAYAATAEAGQTHVDLDLSWVYELTLAGGVSPTPGATEQAIIDLSAGNWAIWADDFVPAAKPLLVTGDPPAVQPIPESTATILAVNDQDSFGYEIDGELLAGPQIVEIVNQTSQPVYIEFLRLSHPVTSDQLYAFLTTPAGLAPDPALGLPADFSATVTPFYSALQSAEVTQWMVTNFAPGSWGMINWLPSPEHGGVTLASLGMIATFDVQ